jgi:hypothetical protein
MKLTEIEFRERTNKLLAEERNQPLRWFYLSYADDESFRGAIIIQAHGFVEACYLADHRGISPGGEVLGMIVPVDAELPPPEYRNKLLSKEVLRTIFSDMATLGEIEASRRGDAE